MRAISQLLRSRLPGFAKDGEWDTGRPSPALAAALDAAAGPEQRCPGATRDEMLGMLRRLQAMESWAAAGKLGLLRALIRDDDQPLPGGGWHGDLPDGWTRSLTHEVALAPSMPAVSAENLMWLAWNLQASLPGTGALLAAGDLTLAKAVTGQFRSSVAEVHHVDAVGEPERAEHAEPPPVSCCCEM